MFDYLQQFNNLPPDLREKVSSPSSMAVITELEDKYKIDLAIIVMKVMIKKLTLKDLPSYFVTEAGLSQGQAESLAKDLKEKIFILTADYLGFVPDQRALDLEQDINLIIGEASLNLPSASLVYRFKSILATYLKGVRNKIDTRATLAKDIQTGGLSLSQPEIERVFKVCDSQKFKGLDIKMQSPASLEAPSSRLDKIISASEAARSGAEYNLKQALEKGEIKRNGAQIPNIPLDTSHELAVPPRQLDLPKQKIAEVKKAEPAPKSSITTAPPAPSVPAAKVILPPISRRPTPASRPAPVDNPAKPRMQDIRPMPKVMGPIEELQFLDLVNFRRLGKTPAEITTKIFSKIKLLEREGYDRMIFGIKAWRQSPVNRLYLKLGQEALAHGIPIRDAIAARQKANLEYLNSEELEAILSLNSKLLF